MHLFRRRSYESIMHTMHHHALPRSLGAFDLVMLGVGCVIGTGIFVMTGIAAAQHAGPAITLSYALAGLTCVFAALAYTELAAMIPVAGSAYTYSYYALGEIIAWLVGWGLVLEYAVGAGAVAVGWSGYMVGILDAAGIHLPMSLTKAPLEGGIVNLPAMLIIGFLTLLLIRGTKESAKLNRILVFVKLGAIFLFLAIATTPVNADHWVDFMPFGLNGVFTGAATIFFAYVGFDAVATAAEEAKNPNRDLPIGIIGSLAICTILYMLVAGVLTSIVPYHTLNNAEPLASALRAVGSNMGSALVATGAIAGMTTVLLVLIYGQTRIFFVMGRDGMLPKFFCTLHPRFKTPHINTIVVGSAVALTAGFAPITAIVHMANIGTLFAFMMVALGVLVLRFTDPDRERTFRCPYVFIVAPLAILMCGFLMIKAIHETGVPFVIWTVAGLLIYFLYSYHHNHLAKGMFVKD
jgi:APA family basic amino acid/polyamine antiporter